MSRSLALLLAVFVGTGCAGAPPVPRPPLQPPAPVWKTLLGDFVVPPLATDGRYVFVATRDGVVRGLERTTGAVAWKAEGQPARLAAAEGVLLAREEGGTLSSLHPQTGAVRWTTSTGVTGSLPAVVDGDRALVAGHGLAAVDLASGRLLWRDPTGAETTSPPVTAGARLVAGEADGTLRCRDRATGLSLWTRPTGSALRAPVLVDEKKRRLYVGTTDKRILEVSLEDGKPGWAWTVGADIAHAGLLLPDQLLFASFDAVLYSLRRGGNLSWRGPLPSRPLSPPLAFEGYVVVACLENELVAFLPESGTRAGSLRTGAEIRTAPVVVGDLVVLGLRDRSVIAYTWTVPPPPAAEPDSALAPPPGGE